MGEPLATHEFSHGGLKAALIFFQRTRDELRALHKVRVSKDWVRLFDVNGDYFELLGLGYPQAEITVVLKSFDTPFKPECIHQPTKLLFKEFATGRRYCWAADRVM